MEYWIIVWDHDSVGNAEYGRGAKPFSIQAIAKALGLKLELVEPR